MAMPTEIPEDILHIAVDSAAPAYDPDGNMLAFGAFTYAWDAENRLTAATSNNVVLVQNRPENRHEERRQDFDNQHSRFKLQRFRLHAYLGADALGLTEAGVI
jgi:hypothetical protein